MKSYRPKRSGLVSFSPDFPGRHRANLHWTSPVKLHIFLDRSSIEVSPMTAKRLLTDRIYPSPGSDGFEIYSESADAQIPLLKYEVKLDLEMKRPA